MGYFIIIRGPLGIGKSTIAEKLSKSLNAKYVSIDKILEEHGLDKVSPEAECIPIENFIKANEFILPEVRKILKKCKIVIFDACFYHKEVIEHIIQNLKGYQHYVFTLKAPLEICIKRDLEREKTHGEEAARAVYKLVSRFDYGIVIDVSNKTIEQTVKEILSYLPKPQ